MDSMNRHEDLLRWPAVCKTKSTEEPVDNSDSGDDGDPLSSVAPELGQSTGKVGFQSSRAV